MLKEFKDTRKRHHASKLYKKGSLGGTYIVDPQNPDHNIMESIAKDWWNSWQSSSYIEMITNGYLKLKTEKEQFQFLKD